MLALLTIFFILVACSNTSDVGFHKPKPHRVTPCACRYKHVLYDLSKLARGDGQARFKIQSPEREEANYYSYNPCIPFTIPRNISITYNCNNVAICYWSQNGQRRVPLGYQRPGEIHCEITNDNNVALVYKQGGSGRLLNYTTTIEMICDRSKIDPEDAEMKPKYNQTSALPVFQVFHQCCCHEGCSASHKQPNKDMRIYYEIGIPVGGVFFFFIAGLVGFMIAKKKYQHNEPGNDPILPPYRDNGYGAVGRQDRRNAARPGNGGNAGAGAAIAGADSDPGSDTDSGTDTDDNDNDADRVPIVNANNDNDDVSRGPSEHDENIFP